MNADRRVEGDMAKNVQTKAHIGRVTIGEMDPNELKNMVRDGLVALTLPERDQFIQQLEAEMTRIKLHMRAYLIPLGIPGRSPEELTPTEIGHLIRFLKMNVPQSLSAIERAMSKYPIFLEMQQKHPLAA
jgi:hypothetical protein